MQDKEHPEMSVLFAKMRSAVEVFRAAVAAAAAVRAHQQPARSDLALLGIRAKDFPKSW
jgi:hypothetical protein